MRLAIMPRLLRPSRPALPAPSLQEKLAEVVEATALELLDPDRIQGLAEDMRIVQLERLHHLGLVVCSVVLSALGRSTDTEGRWLDAQTTYRSLGGPDSSKTSFRTNVRKAVPVMRKLMRRRLKTLAERLGHSEMRGRLEAFSDVLIPDGCAFKLACALSGVHPGTGQPAELKLHAVYSVNVGSAVSVDMTPGSVHDSDGFAPQTWQAGALYIWDLGYNSYDRLVDAVLCGAQVLQRLKERANPVVVASYGPTGCRQLVLDDDGKPVRLNDACEWGLVHKQAVLDLDVEIKDSRGRRVVARLVCVPFAGEDRWYLTSLPREMFTPYDVAELYRVRWECELFFRNWKGAVRLDQVRRLSNPESLLAAVTASMLAAVFSREIAAGLERLVAEDTLPAAADFPPDTPNTRASAQRRCANG